MHHFKRMALTASVLLSLFLVIKARATQWGSASFGFTPDTPNKYNLHLKFSAPLLTDLHLVRGAGSLTFVSGSPTFAGTGLQLSGGKYLTIPLAGNVNLSEGTIVVDATSSAANTGTAIIASVNPSGQLLYKGNAGTVVGIQNQGSVNTYGPSWANDGVTRRVAATWSLSKGKQNAAMNGVVGTAGTFAVSFTGATLYIGNRSDQVLSWVGGLKNVRIYDKSYNDAELAYLSKQ